MKDKIEFKKIREFGDIIGDTFVFIKQNFKPLMTAFIYLSGIFLLAGMVSSIITQLQFVEVTRDNFSIAKEYGGGPFQRFNSLGVGYFVRLLVVIIFMVLTYTSMYVSVLSAR